MRKRVDAPLPGVYRDFRAVEATGASLDELIPAAKAAEADILLLPSAPAAMRDGILIASPLERPVQFDSEGALVQLTPRERRHAENSIKQYPDEAFALAGNSAWKTPNWTAAFRHRSVHVLALGLNAAAVQASLHLGRDYVAQDWLCDPAGFHFMAENNLGAFDIGDTVPLLPGTDLKAFFPVPAKIQLLRDGKIVSETESSALDYQVKQQGAYRVKAFLTVDGEQRPWIYSNAIYAGAPPSMELPVGPMAPSVEVRRNITYVQGKPEDAHKHQLDLYLPKGKTTFPVMMFVHGGSWRTGDRSMYALLGNRFAKAGIGVVIPSYRLMPKNPHPAQINDVSAAFAWVYRNIEQFGGDRARVYLAGHSAGAHLVALLALDRDYQEKYQIPVGAIHGVITISGVYNVGRMPEFQTADDDPSPVDYVHPQSPPFLVTYCQWDYMGLPKQARDFAAALKAAFTPVKLVYIPSEGHISEIIATLKEDDPLARAILGFVQ